jgi:hypothetical protein
MSDPIAWAKCKEDEAARVRAHRKERTEEQKERDREMCRNRQKKLYKKRKQEESQQDEPVAKKGKVLTRSEREKIKEYNRVKQRESRERMSVQKLTHRRKRDAKQKRDKRAEKKKKSGKKRKPTEGTAESGGKGFPSDSARRMALTRIWSKVPKDPEKFAAIVNDFVCGKRSTPRKQAALRAEGLPTRRCLNFERLSDALMSKISKLKVHKDKDSLRDRRLLVNSFLLGSKRKHFRKKFLTQEFGLDKNYLSSISKRTEEQLLCRTRKKRKDATCLDVVQNVQDFYQQPKISRELPCMKSVRKQRSTSVMEVTIEQAYKMWKQDNPDTDVVSASLFQKLRPQNVLLRHKTKLTQCLCECCTNTMFKLWTLNSLLLTIKRSDLKVKDKYQLVELSMCEKLPSSKYCRPGCVYRSCQECGVRLLEERFAEVKASHAYREVQWRKWQTTEYTHDGKIKKKKMQLTKTGTVVEFLDELFAETRDLAQHIFVANWQQEAFVHIRRNLPLDWALMVLDFAENYSCQTQYEIQSAHWCINQVTVHPIVAYYHCKHDDDDMSHIAQEALVIISEDLVHDYHAVHHFMQLAVEYLKDHRGLQLKHTVQFTDGCSAQYKSKGPFADITFARDDHDMGIERNFFGSSHGKGPSDGVSGVVKTKVRNAVKSGEVVVNTAAEMFHYCQEKLPLDSCDRQRRSFLFVKLGDVTRDRDDRVVKSALQGTRSLHAVRSVEPGVIDTRTLGCFCPGCLTDDSMATCLNAVYVVPWQRRSLKMAKQISKITPPSSQSHTSGSSVNEEEGHTSGLSAKEEAADVDDDKAPDQHDDEDAADGTDLVGMDATEDISDLWNTLQDQSKHGK